MITDSQKYYIDLDIMDLWYKYLSHNLNDEKANYYKHVNEIIEANLFQKFYLSCGKNNVCHWVFVNCNGVCGYFDGYKFYEDCYPVSLVQLWGIQDKMSEFKLVNS